MNEHNISLLLSGGGFRATLFHLGTIRYLRESGKLTRVKEVYSVSGGSILAAHLATNWSDYCGDEKQFNRVASELVAFTRSGLRERIIRKSLLCWALVGLFLSLAGTVVWTWFGLNNVKSWLILAAIFVPALLVLIVFDRWFRPVMFLEQGYRRLYKSATLQQLKDSPIKFYFLATNLTTGNIACFSNTGVYPNIVGEPSSNDEIPSSSIRLSECVAASSAFPPLFSPVPVDPKKLKIDQDRMSHPQYLTDGGVFDNLGLRARKILSKNDLVAVVSDAERRFDWSTESNFRLLVGRTSRATDILMNRVNRLEFELIELRNDLSTNSAESIKFIRLQDDLSSSTGSHVKLSPDLERRSRRIRTDLDAFKPSEIQLLFCSGFIAAKHSFEGFADLGEGINAADNGMPITYQPGRWLPIKEEPSLSNPDLVETLDDSENRRLKIWSFKSFHCWLCLLTGLLAVALNPITIGLFQNWPAQPHNITGEKLTKFSDISESYSMLMAFSPRPEEIAFDAAAQNVNLFVLESATLVNYTNFRRHPADFAFVLIPPTKCRITYHNAFLFYEDTRSLVSLEPTGRESEISYDAAPKSPNSKILMIIAIATPSDQEIALTANAFELMVR